MKVKIVSLKEAVKNIDFIIANNINLVSIRDTNPDAENKFLYDKLDKSGIQNIYRV